MDWLISYGIRFGTEAGKQAMTIKQAYRHSSTFHYICPCRTDIRVRLGIIKASFASALGFRVYLRSFACKQRGKTHIEETRQRFFATASFLTDTARPSCRAEGKTKGLFRHSLSRPEGTVGTNISQTKQKDRMTSIHKTNL